MPWFVQAQLAPAWKPQRRHQAEALVRDGPREVGSFAPQVLDRRAHVIAHEIELVTSIPVGGMRGQLGGRQGEDQPAAASVHGWEAEDVSEEGPIRRRIEREHDRVNAGDHGRSARGQTISARGADAASPNGVPSESRQTDHASPAWMTLPPSPRTRSSPSAMSATAKYGSEAVSPGPRPRAWTPTAGPSPRVGRPDPSRAARSSRRSSSSPSQKRRARSGSSAGNSISDKRALGTGPTLALAVLRADQEDVMVGVPGRQHLRRG